jgi:hypothetical protein
MATKSGSLTAKWTKIAEHEVLMRSSHSVAAIGEESAGGGDGYELFVFGGELVARQPKDGEVHVLNTSCTYGPVVPSHRCEHQSISTANILNSIDIIISKRTTHPESLPTNLSILNLVASSPSRLHPGFSE